MVILKIIGILFAVIVLLLLFVLSLRLKLSVKFSTEDGFEFYIKLLCFKFGKSKKKKQGKFSAWFKRILGIDPNKKAEEAEADIKKQKLTDKISTIVTLITLLADEVFKLFKKMRLDRLKIQVICGDGDAAEAAIDYGVVCATVYPLVGYILENVNQRKNAQDVFIGCDFDGESSLNLEITLSVRTIQVAKVALKGLSDFNEFATEMKSEEEK